MNDQTAGQDGASARATRKLASFVPLDERQPTIDLLADETPELKFEADSLYFARIVQGLSQTTIGRDLRYHVTWRLDDRTVLGKDVVALVIGDERYQVPACTPDVLAVFKTGGLASPPLRRLSLGSPRLFAMEAMRSARNRRMTRQRRRAFGLPEASQARNVWHLPLGCFRAIELPVQPVESRPIDVFFAGGFFPAGGSRISSALRPRTFLRARMTEVLHRWRPSEDRTIVIKPSYPGEPPLDAPQYSRMLADSKIALCPRGNFPETFRTFEAARAGCVLVADVQPDAWYYRQMPGYTMPHWSRLPDLLERILSDPSELRRQSEASVRWWTDVVSERAVTRRAADWLGERMGKPL